MVITIKKKKIEDKDVKKIFFSLKNLFFSKLN